MNRIAQTVRNFGRLRIDSLAAPTILLLLILGFGAWLRLTALIQSEVFNSVRGDARSYFLYAANIRESATYSRDLPELVTRKKPVADAVVAPGYPFFVAATLTDKWKSLSPSDLLESIKSPLIVQTVLSTMVIPMIFLMGQALAGVRFGLAAAALTAISPHLVNINIYLLTESLFSFLFLASIWALLQCFDYKSRPHVSLFLAAGALAGAAALTRPTVQYLPFLVAAFGAVCMPRDLRKWAAYLGIFLAIMLPWSIRNFLAIGSISDPTLMIATIQHGGYPNFMHESNPESLGIPYEFDKELSSKSTLSETLSTLGERAAQRPLEYLHWYFIGKPLALFNWDIIPIGTSDARLLVSGDIYAYRTPVTPYATNPIFIASYLVARLCYFPLLCLAAIGSIFVWLPIAARLRPRAVTGLRVISLVPIYVVAVHMIGAPFPRYSIPFQPLIYILGLSVLWHIGSLQRLLSDGSRHDAVIRSPMGDL